MAARWDVLLVDSRVLADDEDGCFSRFPPVPTRVTLTANSWIGPIEEDVQKAVFDVCARAGRDPWGYALYGYVVEDPKGYEWDPLGELATAIGLSHLIRATQTAFELTATVRFTQGGPPVAEVADINPSYVRAWCGRERHRRWLTQSEAELLGKLIANHRSLRDTLKTNRVGRAITTFGQTPYIFDPVIRGLPVACVLEGLVNSGAERPTAQFISRVPLLAAHLGLKWADELWAKKAYRFRSTLAHGGDFRALLSDGPAMAEEFEDLVVRIEDIVREALRRALLDPETMAILEDPQVRWPVPRAACVECREQPSSDAIPLTCPRCNSTMRRVEKPGAAAASSKSVPHSPTERVRRWLRKLRHRVNNWIKRP